MPLKKKSAVPIDAKHPLHKQEKDFRGSQFKYNIEVCKSLYSSLNIFEVSFRNAIDKALSRKFNYQKLLLLRKTSMQVLPLW